MCYTPRWPTLAHTHTEGTPWYSAGTVCGVVAGESSRSRECSCDESNMETYCHALEKKNQIV